MRVPQYTAIVATLMLAACARELSGPAERAMLDAALEERANYWTTAAALEASDTTRRSARLALDERSAPAGSRQAFVQAMLDSRLSNTGRFAAWERDVAEAASGRNTMLGPIYSTELGDLDGRRHAYFWAQHLLYPQIDTLTMVAADQLIEIDSPVAIEALALAASDVRQNRALVEKASRALARGGRAKAVVRILAARKASGDMPELQRLVLATIEDLPSKARPASERDLLADLAKESSRESQIAAIDVLGVVGGAASRDELVELRKGRPDRDVRAALDRALGRILQREELVRPPPGVVIPATEAEDRKLEEAYEREWQKEYEPLH